MKAKVRNALSLSTLFCFAFVSHGYATIPVVINTWPTPGAADTAWDEISKEGATAALDSVEAGCRYCEENQCRGRVGFGGSPDENGEVTLDAMIMDGGTMDVGAVGGLRRVKYPISVARYVLDHTTHTLLVGDLATKFAVENGFVEESLSSAQSNQTWQEWKDGNCQPNFRVATLPDPSTSCGPYQPQEVGELKRPLVEERVAAAVDEHNHDTIGMMAIDSNGIIAAATSTNGLGHKIPGRVGDSPIPGAGAYVDNEVGAAVATGNGDVMMRFLPTYQIVENMRRGMSPNAASEDAIRRILKHYPTFSGAVIGVARDGKIGAACAGYDDFSYCVRSGGMEETEIWTVTCSSELSPYPRIAAMLLAFFFAVQLSA